MVNAPPLVYSKWIRHLIGSQIDSHFDQVRNLPTTGKVRTGGDGFGFGFVIYIEISNYFNRNDFEMVINDFPKRIFNKYGIVDTQVIDK